MIQPLTHCFEVACPAAHAFEVWTRRIDLWWPADHTATGEEGLAVVLEPGVGGRIYQRDGTGVEIDWGWVTLWEPPRRLGYRWHLRRDAADATDVEITFVPVAATSTRVDIVHTGWERLGADGPDWRERNLGGWTTLIPHYLQLIASP
ncbi:MAG: SRPBCC domain-containing protein [Pseudonocardia sp.]|nr:SRPBCC domain-containing protein [Pseudonocardia sp.]